jgi:CRP-like cAMP-binding protein
MITLRRYEPGEVILHENDTGETAFVIDQGRVDVTKELDGRQIHLTSLGVGETFGEMSMIDDKPRSATVTAVEATVVREIHRDGFFESLQTHPEIALHLLKVLFERLREADSTILQLQRANPQALSRLQPASGAMPTETVVGLEGLTPRATQSLPTVPFQITTFPFRIGRLSRDPLVHNDLMIPDSVPWQISRHHLAFVQHAGRIGLMDRGSTLGSLVDGQQLGGPHGDPGPVFLAGSEATLVLGSKHSPFRYRVVIEPKET